MLFSAILFCIGEAKRAKLKKEMLEIEIRHWTKADMLLEIIGRKSHENPIVDYDAGTVSLGGDTHAYDLAKEWKKSGGKVLIAAADYSYLRQKNPEKPQTGKIEEQDGVPFLWIKSPAAADREKKILRGHAAL